MVSFFNAIKLRLVFLLLNRTWKGGAKEVGPIYAKLIIDGLYTFKQVPKFFKPATKEVLIALGAEELIEEE